MLYHDKCDADGFTPWMSEDKLHHLHSKQVFTPGFMRSMTRLLVDDGFVEWKNDPAGDGTAILVRLNVVKSNEAITRLWHQEHDQKEKTA